jgi:hypothetical protein
LRAFENGETLLVCAGMGAAAARHSAETVVSRLRPSFLISAGLAGALVEGWKVGQVMIPNTIIDSVSRRHIAWNWANKLDPAPVGGVLLSGSEVAGPEAKRLLARQYGGQAIDMEAEAVAAVAAAAGVPFLAVKAISDEWDFPMPDLAPYIDGQGRFRTGRFLLHTVLHPYTWRVVSRLASQSAQASRELCRELRRLLESGALDGVAGQATTPRGA